MGLLDNLFNTVQRSVNQVNRSAGLSRAPERREDDLLERQVSAFEADRQRAQEEERRRREAAERARREEEARLRRQQEEQQRKAELARREQERFERQARDRRESQRVHEERQELTISRRNTLSRAGDTGTYEARRQQYASSQPDNPEFAARRFDINEQFRQNRRVSTEGFGRGGVRDEEFDDLFTRDAAAALAIHPRFSVLPDNVASAFNRNTGDLAGTPQEMRDIVALFRFGEDERALQSYMLLRPFMASANFADQLNDPEKRAAFDYLVNAENAAVSEFAKDRQGKLGSFVQEHTEGLPGPDILGTVAASLERFGGAAASIPPGVSEMLFGVGGDTSERIARSVGIHGDDPFRVQAATTVNTAADVASIVPLAASGSLVRRFGAEVAANLILDIPSLATTMLAYDIDPFSKEGAELISLTLGVDLAGGAFAAGIGPAARGAGRGLRRGLREASRVPGGDAALQAAAGAGIGAAGAQLTGNDPKSGAIVGAGAPLAVRIGNRLGRLFPNTPMAKLTHTFGEGDSLYHGSPNEIAGGVPTAGRGTGGRGAYVTSDIENAANYGDNIYEVSPRDNLRFLDMVEPVEREELDALLEALDPATRRELRIDLAGDDVTGFEVLSALERAEGVSDVDAVLRRAGWDGLAWPQEYADFSNEFVVRGGPEDVRARLRPVGQTTADELEDDTVDSFVDSILRRSRGDTAAGLTEDMPRVNAMPPLAQDALAAAGAGGAAALQGEDNGDRAQDAAAIAALTFGRRALPRLMGEGGGLASAPVLGVRSAAENEALARELLGEPTIDASNPRGVITAQAVTNLTQPVQKVTPHAIPKAMRRVTRRQAQAVAPKPHHLNEADRLMTRFGEAGDVIVDNPRAVASAMSRFPVLAQIARLSDPASKMNTYLGKKVLGATVAGANYLRYAAGTQNARTRSIFRTLGPLVGSQPHLRNAAAQVGALGTGIGAGQVAEAQTGNEMLGELGILAGIGAMAATSSRQRVNAFRHGPWEAIEFATPTAGQGLPEQLLSGPGKLYDIIQNPTRYNLTPEQSTALQNFRDVRHDMLIRQTNAFLVKAGMAPLPPRQAHGILQFFEPGSVANEFEDAARATRIQTPGFNRKVGPQLMRDLGDTYEEVLLKHPKLEVARNPFALIEQEVKFHDQIRALATMTKRVKESGGSYKIADQTTLSAMTKQQRLRYTQLIDRLKQQGFKPIAGIDDHIFHPQVVDAVDQLLVPSRGKEDGFLSYLDVGTNFLRQAMFTSDLSAWSMQGAMTAIEDPMGTLRNAHHLVGASFGGQKYFNHWLSNNRELWEDFTASGGVAGREFEGIELETFSIARLPGLRNVEKAGFEYFLPIHRALMFDNVRSQNALISKLGLRGNVRSDVGQLAAEFAKNGPLVAGVLAGTDTIDIPGLEDEDTMALLMGVALGFSVNAAMRSIGSRVLDSSAQATDINVGAARHIGRIGGTLNRQAMGITAEQSQLERIFLARSPALTRNTLILAKHALTDFGPEGAAARFYLLKTAMLLGTALAAYKYAVTGEWDSFDPTDEESVFSPLGFAKASTGATGTLAFSNPNIALMRALLRVDRPDDVKTWRFEDWEPVLGLRDWYAGRTPDIVGKVTGPFITTFEDDSANHFSTESLQAAASSALPLSVQSVFETGLAEQTALGRSFAANAGERLGLDADDRYTNQTERVTSQLASVGGLNFNPESLAAESVRLRNEAVEGLFPDLADRNADGRVDYGDLNQEQKELVKAELENNPRFAEVQSALDVAEAERLEEDQTPAPVKAALDARDEENNRYIGELKDLDRAVRAGTVTRQDFVQLYKDIRENHRERLDTVESTLFTQHAGRRGTDETVREFLDRNQTPEDKAVDDYYAIFDVVANKFGKTNFDRLAREQEKFLSGLDDSTRNYVEQRVAKFDRPSDIKTIAEYQAAQDKLRPYWEASDRQFQQFKADSPTLSQFETRGDFEEAMAQSAAARGMTVYDLMDELAKADPPFRVYRRLLEIEQRIMRLADPEIDKLLGDYYGYAPKNPENKVAARLADLETRSEALSGELGSPQEDEARRRREALFRSLGIPDDVMEILFGRKG